MGRGPNIRQRETLWIPMARIQTSTTFVQIKRATRRRRRSTNRTNITPLRAGVGTSTTRGAAQ
eukprot:9164253-Pyramimonas_sp.AAC.1